ncbi:hypothetical protein PVL29_026715 [Vitis rotundifolia]|uniref:Transcription factor GTE7-like n=1 Tax=Vitis rotundifolia TaxID=103349 RepID=A0AA38YH41_VITRO|nr:hypothetical protein PVL29_026715 [Vitis rotundifolia]
MASAVLASRNEAYWGERKVYMRKYTNNNNSRLKFIPNPNPNPNSDLNLSRQIHDLPSKAQFRRTNEPPAASLLSPVADDSSSLNRKAISLNDRKESSQGGYVTFNIGAYSRRELKELKKRLLLELDQVRNLRNRIESRDFESRSVYPATHLSSSHGGREAISTPRPPPLQIKYALESPGAAASKEKRTPKANQCYPPSEFLIGKNKTVSPKSKKVSGSKRSLPVVSGRDSKRPMPEPEPLMDKLVSSMMRRCGQILTKLMKHKFGWVFNKPVDVVGLGLHDYHKIVKQPMDLGSVKSKLERKVYLSPLDFASDVRLTFSNAMLYNPKGQDVYYMAEHLLSLFDEMFNPAYRKFENEVEEARHRRPLAPGPAPSRMAKKSDTVRAQAAHLEPPSAQIPMPMAAPVPAPAPTMNPLVVPRSSGKLPKPRAKDKVKREMSFEEKAKLGMNLENVPPEKMEQLVAIIRKRNPHMAQDGDDIELDIEAVDIETLWELDRFVSNYKKMESKIRRQGLIMNQTLATQLNKSPVTDNPDAGQKNKKGEIGEEDVDIGEEMPVSHFPPVEIDKDAAYASSSSRSSSGSSSSSDDSSSSDSGSSSGSDSDADSVHSPRAESKDASVT